MRLVILKDGTVPIVVLKQVAEDRFDGLDSEVGDIDGQLQDSDLHQRIQLFEVPDDTTHVGVSWDEFNGFQVYGYTDLATALGALNALASDEAIANSNIDGRHWAVTYDPGDDESYGHVFTL